MITLADVLNDEIRRSLKKYELVSRTDTPPTAILRRRGIPASGHILAILFSIISAGLFLPVYILILVLQRRHDLYLEVDNNGSLRKTKIRH